MSFITLHPNRYVTGRFQSDSGRSIVRIESRNGITSYRGIPVGAIIIAKIETIETGRIRLTDVSFHHSIETGLFRTMTPVLDGATIEVDIRQLRDQRLLTLFI